MPTFWFMFSFWGMFWLVFRGLGRRPELCLFSTVGGVVGVLYLCALAGLLQPGAVALFWLGLAGAAWGVYEGAGPRRDLLKASLTPGVCLVLALTLVYNLAFGQASMQWWDEFSHWGTAARNMLLTHRLPDPQGAIMFQEYPPGAALLQYLAALNTTPGEPTFYLAHFLLSAVPLASLFHGLPWRRAWWMVLATLGLACLAVALNFYICSLMVDTVLALHLAAALLWATRLELTPRGLWPLAPPLLALPLIKGAGLLLALAVTAMLATCWLGQAWRRRKGRREPDAEPPSRRLASAALVLLILSTPLWSHYSWALRGQALGIKPVFDTRQASLAGAMQACTPAGDPWQRTVAAQFGRALVGEPLSYRQGERNLLTTWQRALGLPDWLAPGPLALPGWLGLAGLVAAAGFLGQSHGPTRWRMGLAWAWLLVFGAVYVLGLLVLYLYCFPAHEAQEVASFGRYLNTYLLAMLLLGLGLAAPQYGQAHSRLAGGWRRASWAICLTLFFLGVLSQTTAWSHFPTWSTAAQSPSPQRRQLRPALEEARRLAPAHQKVYVVHQGSDGFPFHLLRYELTPRPTNHAAWSLGQPRHAGDVWTEDLTPEQWAGRLAQGYDFVLLARTDRDFWRRYAPLFDASRPDDVHLFKVVRNEAGGVRLLPARTLEAHAR